MLPTKTSLLVLVLIVRTCRGKVVVVDAIPDERTASLVEGMVEIVTFCYRDQINTIGLAGQLPDSLTRTLSVQQLIPIVVMDDASHIIPSKTSPVVPSEYRYELQVFIVGASSYKELSTIVQFVIRPSIWWNHMASFFILDQSRDCVNVVSFLDIAWQLGLLNAKVMCHHDTYGRNVFNYNPFTSQAPAAWTQSGAFPVKNNRLFTTFLREYQGNEAICLDLDFIKTKDLAGYEILVAGKLPRVLRPEKNWASLYQSAFESRRLWDIVRRSLNATFKFSGATDIRSSFFGEFALRHSPQIIWTTYPHQQLGMVLMSKYRGHMTQLEKIFNLIDIPSRIGMGIAYLVTLIFFKIFVHQALVPALLNLVRITCNTGFANLPDNNASRIFLTGLLFYVVTMQGIYQGDLASLLTNKISLKNVDSLEDVVKFDYKVYGKSVHYRYFEESTLKGRFIPFNDSIPAIIDALRDPSAAYISFHDGTVIDLARQNDWHLSRAYIDRVYVGFLVQPFSYLKEQMNVLMGTLAEADIFESWYTKCNPTKLADFQVDKEVMKNTDFKIIEFSEVRFAFVILAIGLLCATVTFIVEVSLY